MVTDRLQRLQAAAELARFMGSKAWREALERGDYVSGQGVVLALESDRLADVHDRMERYDPPVHIAVCYPAMDKTPARLHFIVAEPAPSPPRAGEDTVEIDPESTVGMFSEFLEKQEHGLRVRFTKWQSPLVVREVTCA